MQELAHIVAAAGGLAAPPEAAAGLRAALHAELSRGEAELALPRSGYGIPVCVAFSGGQALAPAPVALRADPAAAPERAWLLVAAAVGALVEAGGGAVATGEHRGHLALAAPGADPELAALSFEEQVAGIDRLRARAVALPAVAPAEDVRTPFNPAFAVAERVARRGGRPAQQAAVEELGEPEPAGPGRPHDDPNPSLRAARRILQRLRGMGKWGGYHTEFTHLAKGFPTHDRALALAVGEALLRCGLLAEKVSVGQRHVYLAPGRAADIHALIDDGAAPAGLALP